LCCASAGSFVRSAALRWGVVLVGFSGGAALGAGAARNIRQRPVRWYGCFALGSAAGALWSLMAFRLLADVSAQEWLLALGIAGRIGTVAMAMLPATLCLGATLPALGEALVGPEGVGRSAAFLYALNTLGGVAGIAATGFGLPAVVGVPSLYGFAAALSAAAGGIAFVIGDHQRRMSAVAAPGMPAAWPTRGRLRILAAGAGALALASEVMWT